MFFIFLFLKLMFHKQVCHIISYLFTDISYYIHLLTLIFQILWLTSLLVFTSQSTCALFLIVTYQTPVVHISRALGSANPKSSPDRSRHISLFSHSPSYDGWKSDITWICVTGRLWWKYHCGDPDGVSKESFCA